MLKPTAHQRASLVHENLYPISTEKPHDICCENLGIGHCGYINKFYAAWRYSWHYEVQYVFSMLLGRGYGLNLKGGSAPE